MRKLAITTCLSLVAVVSGCTTKETPAPPLAGPSEFALRLALQSIPDSILQDGASQAAIQIEATGADGRAVRALALRIETAVDGLLQDYGTLSARTIVTGEDGRARIVYTAPPRPAESIGGEVVVTFVVTPIGNDYRGEVPRTVDLRLVPPGVILPPNSAPTAAFTFTPSSPLPLQQVSFDATGSTDPDARDAGPCLAACTYRWDFGDGNSGSGIFATHLYRETGNYQVRLTVTDGRGASSVVGQPITVGAAATPTASFTFSPTNPAAGQIIFFNAEPSRAAAGRRIVSYNWDFGSGRTGTGITTSKGYDTPGTYVVTLTVEDDAGALATTTQSVTVGQLPAGIAPTAIFTFSPTSPIVNQTVFFNGSASTTAVGTTITSYAWDFGNGATGSGATPTHAFSAPGTYVVRLTVTNSAGRTGTSTQNVTVAGSGGPTPGPTAIFTFSPTAPIVNQTVFFNGSASTTAVGTTITSYAWDFGNGATGSGVTTTHAFSAPGTYVVRLTVTDSTGRTGTSTQNVPVAGSGGPTPGLTARLTVAPNPGNTATNFTFDASASTPGSSPIFSYTFRFGDGQEMVTLSPTAATTHFYAANGTYQATVTVRDDAGNTVTSTAVTVTVNIALQARLTATPTSGTTATNFVFDARASTPGPGTFIVNYRFTFGDGSFQNLALPTASKTYAATGSYTVTVTITDDQGSTSTAAVVITVTP